MKEFTFAATSIGLVIFNRARPASTLIWWDQSKSRRVPRNQGIVSLLILGDYLLSLHFDGALRLWDAKQAALKAIHGAQYGSEPSEIEAAANEDDSESDGESSDSSEGSSLEDFVAPHLLTCTRLDSSYGAPTCLLHPDTYLNKVGAP